MSLTLNPKEQTGVGQLEGAEGQRCRDNTWLVDRSLVTSSGFLAVAQNESWRPER